MSPNKKKTPPPPPPQREEGLEGEMAKKNQPSPRKWSLRNRFNSFVTIVMAFIIILAIYLTVLNANSWPEEQEAVAAERSQEGCDLFSGSWVYDNTTAYPLYSEKKCAFMSDQSACEKFGRKDLRYQNWRWQPHGCNLPRYEKLISNSQRLFLFYSNSMSLELCLIVSRFLM